MSADPWTVVRALLTCDHPERIAHSGDLTVCNACGCWSLAHADAGPVWQRPSLLLPISAITHGHELPELLAKLSIALSDRGCDTHVDLSQITAQEGPIWINGQRFLLTLEDTSEGGRRLKIGAASWAEPFRIVDVARVIASAARYGR